MKEILTNMNPENETRIRPLNNNLVIIGISGKIGSGKDTTAKMLAGCLKVITDNGVLIARNPFALGLKTIVEGVSGVKMQPMNSGVFDFGDTDFTHEQKNIVHHGSNKSIGRLLQEIGVEMRNIAGANVWVDLAFSNIYRINASSSSLPVVVVIPDVRFENEANAIVDAGGILIRLEGDPAGVRRSSTRDLNHPSETSLDSYKKFHYVVNTEELGMERSLVLMESIVKFDIIENFIVKNETID